MLWQEAHISSALVRSTTVPVVFVRQKWPRNTLRWFTSVCSDSINLLNCLESPFPHAKHMRFSIRRTEPNPELDASVRIVTAVVWDSSGISSIRHIQLDGGLNLRFLRVVNHKPRIDIVISPGELSTSFRGDQSVLFEFSFSSRLEWYANTTTRKKRRKSIAI